MNDPTQILGCTNVDSGYRNSYYPWRDGVFTTCISWVETIVGKGQRAQWLKHKPESNNWTEPPREQFSSLVFMTKRVNGLVDWHVYDLAKMTDEQVYAIEQRFVLDEYQRKTLDAYFNGEVAEPALPAVPAKPARAPREPKAAKQPKVKEVVDVKTMLEEHYRKTKKAFTVAHLEQLRELVFTSDWHNLPGSIKPWQLDMHDPFKLAQTAATPKVDFDAKWAALIEAASPDDRPALQERHKKLAIQELQYIEDDKRLNEAWLERETLRRETGEPVTTTKDVKMIDPDEDTTEGMDEIQRARYNRAMGYE
jgi:hypothetical protein